MALWAPKRSADPNRGTPVPGNPTGPFEPPPMQTAYTEPAPGYPVNNPLGWAPVYERPDSNVNTRYDDYPDPTKPPEDWYEPQYADERARHSVETWDTDGWAELKGGSGKPRAHNPRETPPPEDRPTMKMAPRNFTFTRPFDQWNREYADVAVNSARQMNGTHFSMAGFRRDYQILGMEPPRRSMRNTYRLSPAPWDQNVVDLPPESDDAPPAYFVVQSFDVPAPGRSYRLG